VDTVSHDRSKLFCEAASRGAPQARQIADRFHLQQNLAEALQDFFRHHERVLKSWSPPILIEATARARCYPRFIFSKRNYYINTIIVGCHKNCPPVPNKLSAAATKIVRDERRFRDQFASSKEQFPTVNQQLPIHRAGEAMPRFDHWRVLSHSGVHGAHPRSEVCGISPKALRRC
jgi:hypothetical protein